MNKKAWGVLADRRGRTVTDVAIQARITEREATAALDALVERGWMQMAHVEHVNCFSRVRIND